MLGKSRLSRLEEVVRKEQGEYDKDCVARVKSLVAYVEENSVPKDMIPYDELEEFTDFALYFRLVPEWKYKPKEFLKKDEKYGGKYFMTALKQKCKDDLELSDYDAEIALDKLIRGFNDGIVIKRGSLSNIRVIGVWEFIQKNTRL